MDTAPPSTKTAYDIPSHDLDRYVSVYEPAPYKEPDPAPHRPVEFRPQEELDEIKAIADQWEKDNPDVEEPEREQTYTFYEEIGVRPVVPIGLRNWVFTTPQQFGTSMVYACAPPCIKLILPPGHAIMRYDPTVPPDEQRPGIPELYRDVMKVRREVLVRERGGDLEDIASELWEDSVSLHWVVYITDYVDGESTLFGDGGGPGMKILKRIPIATVQVRPVIGMRQPVDKTSTPPFVGMRARSNYLLMSEPIVLAPYRNRNWIENKLVDAIIRALRGYLPTEFFHDIFGRVIPLSRGVLQKARARHPASVAALRAEWKDKFVKVMPDALRWSGLLYLHADRRRKLWWLGAPGFKVDRKVEPWDTDDPWSNGKIGMYRPFSGVMSRRNLRRDFASLSEAQRKAFNITDAIVSGKERPVWVVRKPPPQYLRGRHTPSSSEYSTSSDSREWAVPEHSADCTWAPVPDTV